LAHARVSNEESRGVWALVKRLLMRNVLVTVLLVCAILLASAWLATMYRLHDQGLPLLLAVSGLIALMGAINGVFERVFVCWDKQRYLAAFASVSLGAQVGCCQFMAERSVVYVQVGSLIASLLTLGLSLWQVRKVIVR
jgi:uncharacterized membrane protein YhaH (DUF805 family)